MIIELWERDGKNPMLILESDAVPAVGEEIHVVHTLGDTGCGWKVVARRWYVLRTAVRVDLTVEREHHK